MKNPISSVLRPLILAAAVVACAMPLTQFGQVYGVLVYGWRFSDFSSPMECEKIARLAGLSTSAVSKDIAAKKLDRD